jgi:hypothetical protein
MSANLPAGQPSSSHSEALAGKALVDGVAYILRHNQNHKNTFPGRGHNSVSKSNKLSPILSEISLDHDRSVERMNVIRAGIRDNKFMRKHPLPRLAWQLIRWNVIIFHLAFS